MKLPDENSDITERLRVWADMDLDYSTTRSSYNNVTEAADTIDAERALADDAADVFLNYADEGYDFDTARSQWLARYREARQR